MWLTPAAMSPRRSASRIALHFARRWLSSAAASNTRTTALAEIDPGTTEIIATAVASDGRTGRASIPISVTAAPAIALMATPWSGVAPLAVRFSVSRDPNTASIELDAGGDGAAEIVGPSLEDQVVTYTRPGIYVAFGHMF